jgi:glycosyltransferase 2 family protein
VLTRLARIAGNPWLRTGLLAVVLAFCGYALSAEWPQVSAGLGRMHWYAITAALAAALAGTTCMMLAWRSILADIGSRLPLRAAARINFLAQLGKYLPGAVWAFAAQVELSHDYQVPRRRSLASVATSLVVMAGSGLVVALVTLPVTSPAVIRHYWWVMCAVPLIVAVLCPPVLGRVLNRVLAVLRSQPLERMPTWPGLGRALAWNLAGWLLLGLQVWALMTGIAGPRASALLLAVGGYSLAFTAGMLLVVLPGGIGARELILIAALSAVLPHGTAVAVAVVARVVTTASDLILGAAGLGLGRRADRGRRMAAAADNYARTSPPSKSPAGSSS